MKKAVLKVDLHDDKGKQKALKAVSSLSGIDSIAIDMKEKKLTVTGDIDPVTVVGKLRKICHTDILTVGPAKEPEKKKDDPKKDDASKKPAGGDNKDDKNKKDGKNDAVIQVIKPPQQFYQPYPAMPAYYYQHQQHQQPYQHHPHPVQTYNHYNRGAEEDPNACVIC